MMLARKLLILCLGIILPTILFAQFEKGTNSLGASGAFSNRFFESVTQANANGDSVETQRISRSGRGSLSYFRFVSARTAIGLGVSYGRNYRQTPFDNDGEWANRDNISTSLELSPQLRYHFPLSERWVAFVNTELDFRYQNQVQRLPQGDELEEMRNQNMIVGIAARPGILWMVTKRWSLEASVFGASLTALASASDEEALAFDELQFRMLNNVNLEEIDLTLRFYF